MNQNRPWTSFALEAEHEHFGMTRIVKWHNALRDERDALVALLREAPMRARGSNGDWQEYERRVEAALAKVW